MKYSKKIINKAAKVLQGLQKGPLNYWQIQIDCCVHSNELYHVMSLLRDCGCVIDRIDAGGRPTWQLLRID